MHFKVIHDQKKRLVDVINPSNHRIVYLNPRLHFHLRVNPICHSHQSREMRYVVNLGERLRRRKGKVPEFDEAPTEALPECEEKAA
jgi:hypothetical protein